jgi:hypothetical protein
MPVPMPELPPESDVIGVTGDGDPLLPADVKEVCATCKSVSGPKYFPMLRHNKYRVVFTFTIYDPVEFAGLKLRMFARHEEKWTQLPRSSKLYRLACVCAGRRLDREIKITKSMFVAKAFRCRLRTVGENADRYTVIEMLVEKIAG